ncbi:MAG: hypothetical protein ACNI3A_17610 [Desulfovibrio sp.]|uniref:hypothetical protein n=1 Tax=Desulfovibrio sp. 7SRBS1 TaxID=3378064 RepID=UPI003B3E4BBE
MILLYFFEDGIGFFIFYLPLLDIKVRESLKVLPIGLLFAKKNKLPALKKSRCVELHFIQARFFGVETAEMAEKHAF